MTIASRLKRDVTQARTSFRAGRAPDYWRRSLSDQVQPLASLRRACAWVAEKAQPPPRLQAQPLLGNCLGNLLDGWETARSPAPSGRRKPHPVSPTPAATPKPPTVPRVPSPAVSQKAQAKTASRLSGSPPQPLPCDLPPKARPALLKSWYEPAPAPSPPAKPIANQPHPRPHPWAKDAPTQCEPAAPDGPPRSPETRSPLPASCAQAAAQHWLTDVEQRSQTPIKSVSLSQPDDAKRQPNRMTDPPLPVHKRLPQAPSPPTREAAPARSQSPTLGQRVSLDYLTFLVQGDATPARESESPTCEPRDRLARSTQDGEPQDGTPQVASHPFMTVPTQADGPKPESPPPSSKQNSSTPLTHPAHNGNGRSEASPALVQPDSNSRFLQPMAASLPATPLPDLLSRSRPDVSPITPTDLRPARRDAPPEPDDLHLLSDKIQQILTAEARRHGINL